MAKEVECQFTDLERMEPPRARSLEKVIFNIQIVFINALYHFRNLDFKSILILILSTLHLNKVINAIKKLDGKKKNHKRKSKSKPIILNLKPGEIVEVLSEEEILSTLDEKGRYQRLGFMPEMRKFCGKKLRVLKRVDRMMVEGKGMRRIKNTVLLEGAFCDGEAHGGCKRTCYLVWREGWLRRVNS